MLCALIPSVSVNVAVMLAVVTTVGGVPLGAGSVFITTVGAGRAAQAVPAAKSSARAVVVISSSVFLMIFLSSHVFRALRDRFSSACIKTPLFACAAKQLGRWVAIPQGTRRRAGSCPAHHVGSSCHVTSAPYSCERSGRITQLQYLLQLS